MSRLVHEMLKDTAKRVRKTPTSEYKKMAEAGHSGAKKILSLASKPHKAKKSYMLDVKKNAEHHKHTKEELHEAHKHMHKHMR